MVRMIRAALVTLGLLVALLAVPAVSQPATSTATTEAPSTATVPTTEAHTTESWDVDTASDTPTTEATTTAPSVSSTEAPSTTAEATTGAPSTVPVVPTDDAQPIDTGNVWGYAACTLEDGSAPDQEFPCYWDATTQGNGQGESYVLIGHDDDILTDPSITGHPAYPAPAVVPDQAPSEAPSCR